jgi:hypothetical protein
MISPNRCPMIYPGSCKLINHPQYSFTFYVEKNYGLE